MLTVYNQSRHTVIARRVAKADSFYSRLKGLILAPKLGTDGGLWLVPCRAIHTVGMRYSIDAVFLDKDLVVVGIAEHIKPLCLLKFYPTAFSVLELKAGRAQQTYIAVGDRLSLHLLVLQ